MLTTLKRNWGYKIGKIKYTPDAADKLRDMKSTIAALFGVDTTPQETIDYWGE